MSRTRQRWRTGESSNVDQHTAEQAGNFLFDLGNRKDNDNKDFESKALDMRTRVLGPSTMAALTFYDILAIGFNSEGARVVGDTIKRLLIGHEGRGRAEAESVLQQSLPREIEVETGIA